MFRPRKAINITEEREQKLDMCYTRIKHGVPQWNSDDPVIVSAQQNIHAYERNSDISVTTT
jgi:hypothetical protein